MAMYGDRFYAPMSPPCPDTDTLADMGERLMLYHTHHDGGPTIFIAAKGVMQAGWVIGTFFSQTEKPKARDEEFLIVDSATGKKYRTFTEWQADQE